MTPQECLNRERDMRHLADTLEELADMASRVASRFYGASLENGEGADMVEQHAVHILARLVIEGTPVPPLDC